MQTGACSITKIAKPSSEDNIAVIGLGAVGLAAVVVGFTNVSTSFQCLIALHYRRPRLAE